MRKFALIFLLTLAVAAQAQQPLRINPNDIAMADTKAPIGLDLMGGNKTGVTVYPNPNNDHILISVAGKISEKKSIVIYNQAGKMVFKTDNVHENTYLVDVSGLQKDLYFIEINSGPKVYRKKWMRS